MQNRPPAVPGKEFSKACVAKGDPYAARCITVRDAAHASKIWLSFSDVPWTAAVLGKHASARYRQVHMQCIDMAAWRGGGAQPHMADFSELGTRVADFAADAARLKQETREYLKPYIPLPYKVPEDLLQPEAMKGMSALFTQLVGTAVTRSPLQGSVATAGWAFSPQPMRVSPDPDEVKKLVAWATQAAKPLRPAVIGLFDPVGITMELNGLALQRALEWTELPERKWGMATCSAVEAIHQAVVNGATAKQIKVQSAVGSVLALTMPATMGIQNADQLQHRLDALQQVSPAEKLRLDNEEWPKYQGMMQEKQPDTFLATYKSALEAFDKTVIMPIDAAYVSWLKSTRFKSSFLHNFDPEDANSGAAYQQVVHACIKDASGRNAPSAYFRHCLGNDPQAPGQVILRALIFNQNTLAEKWSEAAAEKGGESETHWGEISAKVFEAIKTTFVKSSLGQDIRGPLAGVAKYLYQLAGPISSRLGEAINQVADISLARLPERRLLALMTGVLHAEHPNLQLVDVRGMQSPRQAAKTLAQAIAAASGGGAQNLYGSAEAMIRDSSPEPGRQFRGLFLLDKDELASMAGAKNATRLSAVQPETFEVLLQGSSRSLVNAEVKAGVIGAILATVTLAGSYKELMKADGEGGAPRWNFRAGVMALVGVSLETTGHALENMPWAESFITRGLVRFGIMAEFKAAWLVTGGKLLGAAGGVVAAVVEGYEGHEELKYNYGLGFTMMVLGVAEFAAAVIVFSSWTGVGLVLGLLIAAAIWVVALYKTDDLQKWLAHAKFGLPKYAGERFKSLPEQQTALAKLAGG